MFARTMKTAALAAVIVAATAGASFAAQWAWVDQDSKVRANHSNGSPTVNHVDEGDKVLILAKSGSWFKVKIPGQDGWVKASVLDFGPKWKGPKWDNGYGYGYGGGFGFGGSACVSGDHASFCIGY